jgi:hypothetical protein
MFVVFQQMEIFISTAVCAGEFLMHYLLSEVGSIGLCGGN